MHYRELQSFFQREYCNQINIKHGLNLKEPDNNTSQAYYIGAVMDDHLIGACRIILGQENQVRDFFGISTASTCCELSRLVLAKQVRRDGNLMLQVFFEAHRRALDLGQTTFTAIANARLARLISMLGFKPITIKDDVTYFGQPSKIFEWNIGNAIEWYLSNECHKDSTIKLTYHTIHP